jgi:hypothetical protein
MYVCDETTRNASIVVPAQGGTQFSKRSQHSQDWLKAFDSSFAVISTIGITRS